MGKGWVLETVISLAGGLEIAMGPPVAQRTAFVLMVGTGTWGYKGPRRTLPGGECSALGRGAQEERRIRTVRRKDPWAGRQAQHGSAMLSPGCVTLGKSLPLSAKQ